ncbi:MAG: PF20097 family protein [Bacteroidota bacterium]
MPSDPHDPMSERWHATCLRCGGTMEPGYLNGYTAGGAVSRWISGPFALSKWTGFPPGWKRRRKLHVQAYRCTECGFLDLYARDNDAD